MPVDSTPAARRLAALSLGAQAVILVGFAVFYIYELSIGEGSDAVRVVMSALVIALGGIGLAVVKKLVETRGGAIQVISAVNEGASFRFTWPISSASEGTITHGHG